MGRQNDSQKKRVGRPPSEKSMVYRWYIEEEGFETGGTDPWWDRMDWVKSRKEKKAARSFKYPSGDVPNIHAGFLWEVIRRSPDLCKLLELRRKINGADIAPGLSEAEWLAAKAALMTTSGALNDKYPFGMMGMIRILEENRHLDYAGLPEEVLVEWLKYYRVFWQVVAKDGKVPASPADFLPLGPDAGEIPGAGITAFDLLLEAGGGGNAYAEKVWPLSFTECYTRTWPPKNYRNEFINETVLGPFSNSELYPWVSIGKLKKSRKEGFEPLVLAVQLDRPNEALFRDLKSILDRKRTMCGVSVSDRRIKKESFDAIRQLDSEAIKGIPFKKTVDKFERAAGLDLRRLIDGIEGVLGARKDPELEGHERFSEVLGFYSNHPLKEGGSLAEEAIENDASELARNVKDALIESRKADDMRLRDEICRLLEKHSNESRDRYCGRGSQTDENTGGSPGGVS